MSAYVISAVAPSGYAEHWHGINWAKCYQEVKKLQVRIVKATKEGNHRKVKGFAVVTNPLVQRQSNCCETSD